MFIELVDALRCVSVHESTWLVASVDRLHGRHLAEGTLGCPVCGRRYPVREGVADFRAPVADARRAAGDRIAPAVSEADILRARAQLDLVDGGGIVALIGTAARLLQGLTQHVEATYLLINPGDPVAYDGHSVLLVDEAVPLAAGCLRAAAIGDGAGPVVDAIVPALRALGRLVAPRGAAVPNGVHLLARDDREWVGERVAEPSALVPIIGRANHAT